VPSQAFVRSPAGSRFGYEEPLRYGSCMGLARQFGWVAFARLAAAGTQAVTLLLLVRGSALEDVAVLTAAMGVLVLGQGLSDLGLSAFAAREHAAASDSGVVAGALRLVRMTSGGLIAASILAATGFCIATGSPLLLPLVVLAVSAGLEKNAQAHLGVTIASAAAAKSARVVLAGRALTLAVMLALSAVGVVAPVAFATALALGNCLNAVQAERDSRMRVGPQHAGSTSTRRDLIRRSRPFWLNTFAAQVRNLDATIAATLGGPSVGAAFGVTSRLVTPLRMIPTSLATVLMPASAREGGVTLRQGRRIALVTVLVSLVPLVAMALSAPWLVPTLFGNEYAVAVGAIQVMVISLAFAAVASLLSATLQGAGHAKVVASAAIVGAATCLIGVAFGTIVGGATGAAFGLGSSFVVQSAILLVSISRRISER